MKKILVLIALSLLLITNTAFGGPDLVGTWEVESECVRAGSPWTATNHPPEYTDELLYIVITEQQGSLFYGHSCPEDPPNSDFYGAIDGNKIYITFWDSVTVGRVRKNGSEISFISQNQLKNPPSAPGTCIGIATKTDDSVVCP